MKSSSISPQAAAQELLTRRAARKSLIAFTEYTFPKYEAADCHNEIADALDAVLRGEIKNLMIEAPPQHGKTELASRRFPAMALGRRPDQHIIAATYNSDRAGDNSRDVRGIVGSTEYKACYPDVSLVSEALGRWYTSEGGSYISAGIGTALTGRPGQLGIIDDPFKDRKDADSETKRRDAWNWYRSTFLTRLHDGAPKVVINTRWHEDDLSGRILETAKVTGEKWHRITLKAITDGKALWESKFPFTYLEMLRQTLGPREWSSLYQQDPSPEEGNLFKRDLARYYDKLPAELNYYMSSDAAVTEDDAADFSEIAVWGVDPNDNVYVVDWWYGQVQADVYIEQLVDWFEKYRPLYFASGKGVIKRAIEPFLLKSMRKRRASTSLEWFSENATNNKVVNIRSFQALYNNGQVYWPAREDWAERALSQLFRHPTGAFDDACDTCMFFGRLLAKVWEATKDPDDDEFNPDTYKPTVQDFLKESFGSADRRKEW